MIKTEYLMLVIGMGLVTYIPLQETLILFLAKNAESAKERRFLIKKLCALCVLCEKLYSSKKQLMIKTEYLMLVIGMGLVTYIPRWMPLFFLSKRKLPPILIEWLDLIPAAILSALLVPELVTAGSPRHIEIFRPELLAAIPTLLFAVKTKSLGGTVVLGMFIFWLLEKIM